MVAHDSEVSVRPLVAVVGGATAGGASLLFFEYLVFALRRLQTLSVVDHVAIAVAAVLLGAVGGTLAGVPLAAAMRVALNVGNRRAWGVALGAAALTAAVVDAFVYVNLYPDAHTLLGVGALATAAAAGTALTPLRWTRALAWFGLACIPVALLAMPPLVAGHQRRRHAAVAHAPILGRSVAWWAAPAVDLPTGKCQWPTREPVKPSGAARGSSVLLVTIDAFRGDLGGRGLAKTLPKTAARLRDGVRFDRAHAAAPRTTYSTYAMLTGRLPHTLGFVAATTDVRDRFIPLADDDPIMVDPTQWKLRHKYPLADATPTLPGLLGPAGYLTAAIVADVALLPAAGITRQFQIVDDSPYQSNGRRDHGGQTSEASTDAAIAVLDRAGDDPVFMWVHYRDPHHPYEAYAPTPATAGAPARYVSEFRRVDDQLDRLLEHLRTLGRDGDTIVVVTGDHGEEFRDHGGLLHGTTLYQELIHVPLLVFVPQLQRGRGGVVVTPVSLIDLAPTLVDLLGVVTDDRFDGRSLVPWLRSPDAAPSRGPVFAYNTSYTAKGERQAAVIDGPLKLIEDEAKGTLQLFDLAVDPKERTNLADDRPDERRRLHCLLRAAKPFATR